MASIYSCKLYRGSKRKEAIKTAIGNPVNQELVMQLKEDVDKGFFEDPKSTEVDKPVKEESKPELDSDEAESKQIDSKIVEPTKNASDHKPHKAPSHRLSKMMKEEEKGDYLPPVEPAVDTSDKESTEPSEVPEADVESSEDLEPVEGVVEENLEQQELDILGEVTDALETFSNKIRRIAEKASDEVWIYLDDSINLNTVMEDVIELLSAIESRLSFNRLARTENAIVFTKCDIQ